jgi:hypothetical protein
LEAFHSFFLAETSFGMVETRIFCLPIIVLWIITRVLNHSNGSVPWMILNDIHILYRVIDVDVVDTSLTVLIFIPACFDLILFDSRKWVCLIRLVWHSPWLAIWSNLSIRDICSIFLWVVAIFWWVHIFLIETVEEVVFASLCWFWFSPCICFLENIIKIKDGCSVH